MIKQYFSEITIPQVQECEVKLFLEEKLIQTFLCTPEALEELVIGHLYCRGIISSERQIAGIDISPDKDGLNENYTIRVELSGNKREEPLQEMISHPTELKLLQSCAEDIQEKSQKYSCHGGIHCAALYDGLKIVSLYEDVGRHNAFDKAVGSVLNKGFSPSGLTYFSSGRINTEIAEKASVCRIPLLISRSIATTRACSIARQSDMRIVGRIESKSPVIYTDIA